MNRIILLFLSALIALSAYTQQRTTLVNKGVLYVGTSSASSDKPALYIDGDYKAIDNSQLHQNGKTVLTGNFYNNVSSGHTFAENSSGSFEFKGDKVQRIFNVNNPKENYIAFPNLIINNQTVVLDESVDSAAVVLPSNVGINTKNVILERGRLILDTDVVGTNETKFAHLLIDGETILPSDNRSRPKNARGIIQIKMAIGDNYNYDNGYGSLIAFTPPFKRIYSDYFFYNFLTRPTSKGLFGDNGQLITSPKVALDAGKGYIVGRGIVPANHKLYNELWDEQWKDAKYSDRATNMLSFGRDFAPENFTKYVTAADAFTGEVLVNEDVDIVLTPGWNYLGNPYTVPLDMSTFLDKTSSKADDWKVSRGDNTTYDVENKFYILSQGKGKYNEDDVYSPFNYTITYLLAQKVGGTVEIDGNQASGLIAPMQVFAINKIGTGGNVTMRIPKAKRTHGNAVFTRTSVNLVDNELLIETKDTKSGSFDRMCVVFRNDASLKATDEYDAGKIINGSGRINQIYTRSEDNKNLVTSVVPFTTQKLTLYFKPADEKQDIELNAYRLQSLTGMSSVKLEDTKTGKVTDLLVNPTYKFTSAPTDKVDRFVLRFNSTVGINDGQQIADIEAYYAEGTVHIQHLQDIDINSSITLYDVSGVQLLQEKVSNTPSEEFNVSLSKGTYILKVSGKRNEVRKLLVK